MDSRKRTFRTNFQGTLSLNVIAQKKNKRTNTCLISFPTPVFRIQSRVFDSSRIELIKIRCGVHYIAESNSMQDNVLKNIL
jgi:hypothetical protein